MRGVLGARYRLITIGSFALVFVAAFENLAVTTVMPVISAELDGASLYAVAFAGPLAVSVLGMVVSGTASDRNGPVWPLYASVALFATGLLVAGTATSMGAMVAGRLVHGLGGGAMTVAIYVIVARVYPTSLQPRIFGAFAAAWVLPALVGPYTAGLLGDTVGWRWVFLGVAVLVLPALAMVVPAMRLIAPGTAEDRAAAAWSVSRIVWAVLLGLAILALSLASELDGVLVFAVAGGSLVLAVVALRPLLPRHTLLGARGLPSVILIRMLVAGGYTAAEVYLPYLLTNRFALDASTAGLALSAAGIAWGLTSWLQGRLPGLGATPALRLGTATVVGATAVVCATAFFGWPAWVSIAGWAFSGAGMGLAYPKLSVLTLSYSKPGQQGFNSSALSIADAAGPAMSLAIAGILFGVLGGPEAIGAFGAVFLLATCIATAALVMSGRTAAAPAGRTATSPTGLTTS